ncbi:MAG: site-2 protease family protein [Thermoplasmata archaeon]
MSAWSSQTGYNYTVGARLPERRPLKTSPTEILHLVVAALVLTFDFAVLYGGLIIYSESQEIVLVATSAGATLTGFVAHEMAHKISAQRRGYWAEFRISPFGLIISIITATFHFLFAAPGATMIGGMARPEDWGRTSLAGPVTNFGFALGFLAAAFLTTLTNASAGLFPVLLFLAFINSWFAAFNMIPFGPLDGAKVLRWNKSIWAASFATFAVLAGILYFVV